MVTNLQPIQINLPDFPTLFQPFIRVTILDSCLDADISIN